MEERGQREDNKVKQTERDKNAKRGKQRAEDGDRQGPGRRY